MVGPRVLEVIGLAATRAGVRVLEGLSFDTDSATTIVVGALPLFQVLSGELDRLDGEVRVHGEDLDTARRAGRFVAIPMPPRIPPSFRTIDFLEWSGRLLGFSKAEVLRQSVHYAEMFGLGSRLRTKLRLLPECERRAVALVAGLASGAETLAMLNPFEGLSFAESRFLGKRLLLAMGERRWIAFSDKLALSTPLELEAEAAVVLHPNGTLQKGPIAELLVHDRQFLLRIEGVETPFMEELQRRGIPVKSSGNDLLIDCKGTPTSALFAAALDTNTRILDLAPIADAFK